MRRITSCAITGVACVSMTITASSPITMPVLGSPSAVYAYACSESLSKLTFFSSRSACDANFFSVMEALDEGDEPCGTAVLSSPRKADTQRHLPRHSGFPLAQERRTCTVTGSTGHGTVLKSYALPRWGQSGANVAQAAVFLDRYGCSVGNSAEVCSVTIAGP